MHSIRIKLTLTYSLIGLTILLLTLAFIYFTYMAEIERGARTRAETLANGVETSLSAPLKRRDAVELQEVVEVGLATVGVSQFIVLDASQSILALAGPLSIDPADLSPWMATAIQQDKPASQVRGDRLVYIHPLHSPPSAEVIGVLWIEVNILEDRERLLGAFKPIVLLGTIIFVLFNMGQHITLKAMITDRIKQVETAIAHYMREDSPSALIVGKTYGSEDEINALAQTFNYLITSLHNSKKTLESERDFALQVMNSMGDGLTITNADGIFEFVNPAYARLLGYAPKEIVGHSPMEFSYPDEAQKMRQAWETRKEGKPSTYETRLHGAQGKEVNVLISSVPRFHDGDFIGSIAVVTDITERIRFEQMKTDFVNRASHELRTPLTTAILMADLLSGECDESKRQEYFSLLKQELNRQRLLLNDMLVASRIESNRYEVHLSPAVIPPIIEDAISSISPQAKARQIVIETDIQESLPMAFTDRAALLQVLLNLIANAVKFSRECGNILVSARAEEDSILISVQDHGVGIPALDLPHLGERFYRAQNATALEIQGSGLGLYIITEIMESLQGRMEIRSIENWGTTVSIYIPQKE